MIELETWRNAARYSEFNGAKIAWWQTSEPAENKPWLLLIHGYPTSSWDWSALWPQLEARFNLIALDMLGFGLSDKPKTTYSIFDQADLQEALLSELGVGAAHLFVHDYGNTVGQELLARHNEGALSFSIQSLCFLNGGLFPEQHRARLIQKVGLTPLGPVIGLMMTRDRLRKTFDSIFGEQTKASDEEIDGHFALIKEQDGHTVLHRLLRYIPERRDNRPRWVGALTDTRVPLRLINGGADPVSGRHLYHHYKSLIPDADAVLFDDIGHYPHTEAPTRVLGAFTEFHTNLGTFNA